MPELPEVETIRRQLEARILGLRVTSATLHRRDVLRGSLRGRTIASNASRGLLDGGTVVFIVRHGKQLAIEVDDGRIIVVHLGMSGRLLLDDAAAATTGRPRSEHVHATWAFAHRSGVVSLAFEDPRRFGGIIAMASRTHLEKAWQSLGPDALTLRAEALEPRLRASRRAIKGLLLDQSCVAGIGNIYADEILHRAFIHPMTPARRLAARAELLATTTRSVLERAVELGGSTIRDYRTAAGDFGSFQEEHRVYGREGTPCAHCLPRVSSSIRRITLGGRSTFFCPRCQPRRSGPSVTRRLGTRVMNKA